VGTTGGVGGLPDTAAGPLASVTFLPLTDTLPVFSEAGNTASLSIGAIAVQPSTNPVVLAGTGDPNDATDSYYGEGLLRSTDGGATWSLLTQSNDGPNGHHSFAGLAAAGIAFSSATPTLAVAAFSTSFDSALVGADSSASVPGLYYSTDAGATWQMATLYDGASIVQQPLPAGSPNIGNAATSVVWDALRGAFFAAVRSHGYYSSTDGITWTRLSHQPGVNLSVANCPVAGGLGSATCSIFRGTLAVEPASGDLYALTIDASDVDQGLWQDRCNAVSGACSDAAPVFANRIDAGALDTTGANTIAQGDYNLALAAAANGTATNLYAGTVDLYACTIAAGASTCALRNTTNALDGCNAPAQVAPAQHAIAAFAQSGNPILFLGNDGGLWRSLDGVAETGSVCDASDKTHFDNLNGTLGSLAEIVAFAQNPTSPHTLLAGLGGNGSAATTTASAMAAWPQLSAGEGGQPAIDPNTPTNWMLSIGAGVNLKLCAQGTNCAASDFVPPATIGEAQVSQDTTLLDAPALLDPSQTTNVLTGTCRVWRGPVSDGSVWSSANAISGAFDGTNPATCTATNPLLRSLAAGGPVATNASPQLAGSEVIYAGLAGILDGGLSQGGAVFVATSANTGFTSTSWLNIANNPVTNDIANNKIFNPAGFDVSSLTADAHDATGATVYATIMGFGYTSDTELPHVYRSTDFGAHWLNITANLPDAPANALAVDPNDANTVYVATDTGVYVTTAITTCSVSNCWTPFGTSLPNSPVLSLVAGAQLPTGDGRRGMLRAGTYGRGIWQTPLLSAISLAQPAITLSANSLSFTAQQVSTESVAQTITVTSTGNAPAIFGQATINATSFAIISDTCSGQTLAVNATCSITLAFAPTAMGSQTGTLTIYANTAGGQAQVSLSGTGTAAANITLNPLSLSFAATIVNQTAAAQTITVNNTGGTTATLQTPVVSGDFFITANTCSASLPPSTSCTFAIAFTPTAAGTRTGSFSIADTSTGVTSTQTATLSGTGESPATDTLSTATLIFAAQQVGTASAGQQVTMTNAGDVALTLQPPTVNSTDFTVTNGCGTSLPGKTSCAYTVTFVPTATGTRTGTLTIADGIRSQTVALTGVAVAPAGVSLSPTSLTFASTGVGLSSAEQAVTLTNNGGVSLALSGATASANFAIAANGCPATLVVNASCTMEIVFAPATAGPLSGSLTLTDNAATAKQTVSLAGTGIDFTLMATGPTTATLASGGSITYSLLLSSVATISGNVAFACSGQPTNSTCNISPATGTLGTTTPVSVTILTGVQARMEPRGIAPWRKAIPVVFAMLALPMLFLRRRKSAWLAILLVSATLSVCVGCGSGRAIPASSPINPSYPTPTGTYNLTVAATAAGITRSVPLTLLVQ
jgi:hypothetical protein